LICVQKSGIFFIERGIIKKNYGYKKENLLPEKSEFLGRCVVQWLAHLPAIRYALGPNPGLGTLAVPSLSKSDE